MPYVGRDFDPADVGDNEVYAFDFVNDLGPGDSIQSSTWMCGVAATSKAEDDDAEDRLSGDAVVTGTVSKQRAIWPDDAKGVRYWLKGTVVTLLGETKSLWSYVNVGDAG